MNNIKPLFSIIIPTFNRSSDLVRCLNSLVSQTFKDFEVIVCDNASTDNTIEVIEKYEKILNLKAIRLKENSGGPAKPRNTGLMDAVGEWVCFLDSDDWYSDDRLEYIFNLNLEKIDFIYHDLKIIRYDKEYKTMHFRQLDNKNAYYDMLFNLNAIATSSTCIRRTVINKAGFFKESTDINGIEDFDLWLRIAKEDIVFKYVPKVLGYYFVGNNNLTFYDERQSYRFENLYNTYINIEKDSSNLIKIKAALTYKLACISFQSEKFVKGFKLLGNSFLDGSYKLKQIVIQRFFIGLVLYFKSLL